MQNVTNAIMTDANAIHAKMTDAGEFDAIGLASKR